MVPVGLSQPLETLKDNGQSRKINLFLLVSKVYIHTMTIVILFLSADKVKKA